jgi:hypothetical protein
MKSAFVWFAGLMALLIGSTVYAGTVYEWTDENGVRHFSNTGAPAEVEAIATTAEETAAPEVEEKAAQEAQQEQDEILSDAPAQGTPTPSVREQAEQLQQERLSRQVEQERKRLEAEIAQIDNLSVGVSFTPGMKAARMEPLKEQLDLLNSNPEQYFRMKREGAFTQSGRRSRN